MSANLYPKQPKAKQLPLLAHFIANNLSTTKLELIKRAASVVNRSALKMAATYKKDKARLAYLITKLEGTSSLAAQLDITCEIDKITSQDTYSYGLCANLELLVASSYEPSDDESLYRRQLELSYTAKMLTCASFLSWKEYSGAILYPVYDANDLSIYSITEVSGHLCSQVFHHTKIKLPVTAASRTTYTQSRARLLRHIIATTRFIASPACTDIAQLIPALARKAKFSTAEEAPMLVAKYLELLASDTDTDTDINTI